MDRRAVITGIGVVSPIGIGKEEFWQNALNGKSGIKQLKRFDTSQFPTHLGAEVEFFEPNKFIKKNNIKNMDLTSQFAVAASILALEDARLDIGDNADKSNMGVVVGTTLGTICFILSQQMQLASSNYLSVHNCLGHMALHNCLSADISVEVGFKGASETISSACVSGIAALDYAVKKIKYEDYDCFLAGGAECAFSPLPYAGLNIINALTNNAVRPFDERADGTVLGEGAAILFVEELEHAIKRKANIYCEVSGTELLCEGYNHFKRNHNAEVGALTIENVVKKSNVAKEDIGFINAHGMGILPFDIFEAKVLKKYFGSLIRDIPVTSIKPLVGHPLAAASALQVAVTALAIKESIIPHTLNTKTIVKGSSINLVIKKPLKRDIRVALINSYAFGGKCASSILKKYEKT